MAALINAAYVRSTFNVHADVVDARITPYIAVASKRLLAWVGAANYADSGLLDELKLAEGLITMHLLILNLNVMIRAKGLVMMETVEGNVQVKYMTPAEAAATARAFLDQADQITADYQQSSDLPPVPIINEEVEDIEWPS